MQLLCKVSNPFADVTCPVCGQGFMVYWTRQRAGEREEQGQNLQQALRAQHCGLSSTDVHAPAFQVPEAPMAVPHHLGRPIPTGSVPVYS